MSGSQKSMCGLVLEYHNDQDSAKAFDVEPHQIKGGYAHFNMYIFHFKLIDLDLWNAFCEVSPWGSFLFTLQRQKKVCTPGDIGSYENTKEIIFWYTN